MEVKFCFVFSLGLSHKTVSTDGHSCAGKYSIEVGIVKTY